MIHVFIGKPGVGKSTLIREAFPGEKIRDVRPYIRAFEKDGKVPEEKTLEGYENFYLDLENAPAENLVVELGTNHPEFNIGKLSILAGKKGARVFLCDASVDTCRSRAETRGIYMDKEELERRLARNFPETHIGLLKRAGVPYFVLNMEKTLGEALEDFRTITESSLF